MAFKKIQFDQDKPNFEFSGTGPSEMFFFPNARRYQIELLEIKGVETPSVLEIEVKNYGPYVDNEKRKIRLYKYRSQFRFQNGIFILDTSNMREFELDLSDMDNEGYYIKVLPEGISFNLTMYGQTDRPEPKD